ncbi:hypothetical protein JCM12298_29890 [Desulfothermus naphthae]
MWMGEWVMHKGLDIWSLFNFYISVLAHWVNWKLRSSELGYISSNNRIFSQIEILRRKPIDLITHLLINA